MAATMEVRGLPEDDEWMAEAFVEDAEKAKVEVKKKEEVVEDSDDGGNSFANSVHCSFDTFWLKEAR